MDNNIENLKREIRLKFIDVKSKETGSRFILTKKSDNDKIWNKAAELAAFFFLDADTFVYIIYNYYKEKHLPLLQYYLVGSKAEQIIRNYKENSSLNKIPEDKIDSYIDLAFNFASKIIRAQNDIEYSLYSPSNDFEPWLRLYLSKNLSNKDEIYAMYADAAKQQLIENPKLAKALEDRQINLNLN